MNFNPSSFDNNTDLCYLVALLLLSKLMMDPESECSIIMAPGKRGEIYEGKYDDVCSVADFLSHMPVASASALPCQEVFRKEDEVEKMHVFWHPSKPTSKFSASGRSVQEQIKRSLEVYSDDKHMLVQFWIPKRSSSGRTVLTVSEQPFAMGGIYKGLCRYRYCCIQPEIDAPTNEVGPIERVFNGGSSELCENIDSYSIQDFPMRDYAKGCGIKQYVAVPISKSDDDQKCIGVMELLTMTGDSDVICFIDTLLDSLVEDHTDLTRTLPHARECKSVCSYLGRSNVDKAWNMMQLVRTKLEIPLIQIWAPCLCGTATRGTELFCHLVCPDHDLANTHWSYWFTTYNNGAHSVKSGKGLVGRAYSQTKCCFYEDISRLRVSDNPLVQNASSFNLTACFAIPLQSINPNLHPFILEVFLPHQQNYDHANLEALEALLNSILATIAKYIGMMQLFEISEEFDVKFSTKDEESFVLFDVRRSFKTSTTGATIESGREENNIQLLQVEDNAENRRKWMQELMQKLSLSTEKPEDPPATLEDTAQSSWKLLASSHQMLGSNRKRQKREITLDMINQYYGRAKLADAARELKVCPNTFRDRFRKFGIEKWPKIVKVGGRAVEESEIRECSNNNEAAAAATSIHASSKGKGIAAGNDHQIDQGYRFNVKASCRDDSAKFHFYSNSGIEELRRELAKRFELEGGRFKIKYKDDDEDDELIILSCNEDLIFHIKNLKASKKSTMILSVFPFAL